MQKTILLLLSLFLSASIYAKENSFFAGTRLSNGRFINAIKFKYDNKEKYIIRQKSYCLSNYYVFGGTIKNISISSGIGYTLYRLKNTMDYGIFEPFQTRKNHLISLPLNIDYSINVYKNKLFVTAGTGIEYIVTISQKYKFPRNTTVEKYKQINEFSNPHAVIINVRCGLLYTVNKRIDICSSFDFGIFGKKYLDERSDAYVPNGKRYDYILSNSIGLNIKFGKNSKAAAQ